MSLYGYKEVLDNRTATLVVAADRVEEYVEWIDAVINQIENKNWVETYASTMLDALTNPTYKGYKHHVLAVYHTDEEQREAFWAEWEIQEVKSAVGRDRQADMMHVKNEEIRIATETPEQRDRTIEQAAGLDVYDPWDRRSEEEKEEDRIMKEKMQELRKAGEVSDDSFGGAEAQRASRPESNNIPGAYGRTQAINALGTFAPDEDFSELSNDELKQKLEEAGVPGINGVYDDDKVPQKATEDKGNISIRDIDASKNSDGSWNIAGVMATKHGGEVDEVEKTAREQAHEEKAAEAKAGRRSFSPDDFAAVLRGDGSADAVTHVKGDNRHTRQATEAPELSEEAEAARKEYQDDKAEKMKNAREQARREEDVKARGERDRGVFRGADLVNDDEATGWDELPEAVQKELEEAGLKRESIAVKNYPYNSELGGRALLPFDGIGKSDGMRMVGGINLDVEGTMTMNGPGVAIASRPDTTQDGYGVYARKRMVRKKTEGGLDLGDIAQEVKVDVWLVRVRAS